MKERWSAEAIQAWYAEQRYTEQMLDENHLYEYHMQYCRYSGVLTCSPSSDPQAELVLLVSSGFCLTAHF